MSATVIRRLAAEIRSEAAIADRPGSLSRLERVADELEALIAGPTPEEIAAATEHYWRGAGCAEDDHG